MLLKLKELWFSNYGKSLREKINLKIENGMTITGGVISTSEIQSKIDGHSNIR